MKKIVKYSIFLFLCVLFLSYRVEAKEANITAIDCAVQGDSVLLESQGKYLLMDTCRSTADGSKLIEYLKGKQIKNLDIYISHYHLDHYGGLEEILGDSYFTVGKVYLPKRDYIDNMATGASGEVKTYFQTQATTIDRFVNIINSKGISKEFLWTGSSFSLGDASVSVVGPINEVNFDQLSGTTSEKEGTYINNNSLVSLIQVGNTKYLTAGDIEEAVENDLISSNIDLSSDIMKLSHHGVLSSSNTDSFMRKVKPSYAFYEYYEYPSTGSMSTSFNIQGINVYSTSSNGDITFNIKDDVITVNPTKNYKSIKFNYINEEDNSVITTHEYKFNQDVPYYTIKYQREFENYVYDETKNDTSTFALSGNKLEEDKEYNLYYKLKPSSAPQVVEVPDTLKFGSRIVLVLGVFMIIGGLIIFNKFGEKKEN